MDNLLIFNIIATIIIILTLWLCNKFCETPLTIVLGTSAFCLTYLWGVYIIVRFIY
jgi:hypothetical protein